MKELLLSLSLTTGALAPIADRVIHMHDARVQSIELNATPQDIDSLEY